jgi:hypothetical protein
MSGLVEELGVCPIPDTSPALMYEKSFYIKPNKFKKESINYYFQNV